MIENFEKIAKEELSRLSDYLEDNFDHPALEIDFIADILYITIDEKGQYVINKHTPMKQIWLSSPISGAHHFSYDESKNQWISTGNNELNQLLINELKKLTR